MCSWRDGKRGHCCEQQSGSIPKVKPNFDVTQQSDLRVHYPKHWMRGLKQTHVPPHSRRHYGVHHRGMGNTGRSVHTMEYDWPSKGRNRTPAPRGRAPRMGGGGTPATEGHARGPHSHEVPESSDSDTQSRRRGRGSGWGSVRHGDRVSAWGMECSGARRGGRLHSHVVVLSAPELDA